MSRGNEVGVALEAKGASVSYGDHEAVRRVDMRVEEGEVRVILGRSGSGKTTLLRAVAGFERLSAGALELMGASVDGPGGHVPTEKRSVGLVFQDYALFPHMTVGKNVGFGMRPKDEGEVRRLLELVDLAARSGARPSELSGGEQQRVALARALAARPSVMLLDEPFSNLDPELREGLRAQTFEVLREGGHTALMVTHSASEAMAVADRISVMHAGEVLQTGTPEELYDAPRSARVARARRLRGGGVDRSARAGRVPVGRDRRGHGRARRRQGQGGSAPRVVRARGGWRRGEGRLTALRRRPRRARARGARRRPGAHVVCPVGRAVGRSGARHGEARGVAGGVIFWPRGGNLEPSMT